MEAERKPRITFMGEEVPWESLPEPEPVAYHLSHYFAEVKISPRALNQASKIIEPQWYIKHGGLHALLQKRANEVFSKLPASKTVAQYKNLKYIFDFDKDGPVLKSVSL